MGQAIYKGSNFASNENEFQRFLNKLCTEYGMEVLNNKKQTKKNDILSLNFYVFSHDFKYARVAQDVFLCLPCTYRLTLSNCQNFSAGWKGSM